MILADLEPLHPVDNLDRGADDEVGRPLEATTQHHGFCGACCLPCGGADRSGLRNRGPRVVAEPLRQDSSEL